ncbi:unnamed protein product [Brachionus calyciflorus]|uniref:Uncharacterized protein n=1 Tax=Brachionus calyciflorus TaxID=104777 RepID=A0A814DZ40_9BILA|nr:unnamed protein product [Brachionus calyciflorus]
MKIYFLILSSLLLLQVNSYCIYNSSPNQIRIRHLVSASFWQSFGGVHWRMETKNINSGDKYCCNWSNPLCFSDYAVAPNSQSRSTYRIVDVACSKYGESRDEFTQVRFPRGGYLDIKQSVFDNKNNWIEVHGHLNEDLGYWYRCGYTWQHND